MGGQSGGGQPGAPASGARGQLTRLPTRAPASRRRALPRRVDGTPTGAPSPPLAACACIKTGRNFFRKTKNKTPTRELHVGQAEAARRQLDLGHHVVVDCLRRMHSGRRAHTAGRSARRFFARRGPGPAMWRGTACAPRKCIQHTGPARRLGKQQHAARGRHRRSSRSAGRRLLQRPPARPDPMRALACWPYPSTRSMPPEVTSTCAAASASAAAAAAAAAVVAGATTRCRALPGRAAPAQAAAAAAAAAPLLLLLLLPPLPPPPSGCRLPPHLVVPHQESKLGVEAVLLGRAASAGGQERRRVEQQGEAVLPRRAAPAQQRRGRPASGGAAARARAWAGARRRWWAARRRGLLSAPGLCTGMPGPASPRSPSLTPG